MADKVSGRRRRRLFDLHYVNVDQERILRGRWLTCLDNAIKYTPSGKITVGLTGDG